MVIRLVPCIFTKQNLKITFCLRDLPKRNWNRKWFPEKFDNSYPHDGRADRNPYPHDRRADKDSYPHDSNNQCIILRLQLSFAMINVQLMLV